LAGHYKPEPAVKILVQIDFPVHVAKQVIEAYQSSSIPQRPDYAQELGSIAYTTPTGCGATYLFEVPDDKVAEFERNHIQRTTFIGSRATGFVAHCHVGLSVPEVVGDLMPLLA